MHIFNFAHSDVGTIQEYVNPQYISIQMFLGRFPWDCLHLKNLWLM